MRNIRICSAYANKQVVQSSILVVPFLDRFHHGKKQNKLKRIKRGRVLIFDFVRNSVLLKIGISRAYIRMFNTLINFQLSKLANYYHDVF